MVQKILDINEFVNNKYSFQYENREVFFTIVDEEFMGMNRLNRINRITIMVSREGQAALCTTVIGLGDNLIGIKTDNPSLRGKLLNKDNMEDCIIELYEDGD